jgi:signal peptidase I
MTPNLRTGDKIFVSKFLYGYSEYSIPLHPIKFNGRVLSNHTPARGDIVVFTLPHQPDVFYIKRVIGLPGDKIEIKDNHIYLNDKTFEYSFVKSVPAKTGNNENFFPVNEFVELNNEGVYYSIYLTEQDPSPKKVYIVPKGEYFMMGDNRSNSGDSRFDSMGFIPFNHIIGRAELIFFSTITDGIVPTGVRFERIFKFLSPSVLRFSQPQKEIATKRPDNEIVIKTV